MSDREFENYLQILRGLLRLNRNQGEAISAELRSHMEDRLEDLLAQGLPRDEAIQLALAEFGDAAGLGNKFGAISLHRKRRWLMRLMTFSTAATLLIAASLITFWPGRNAAPGLASLEAQAPPASKNPPSDRDPFAPPTPEEIARDNIADPFGAPAPAATPQPTKTAKPRNSASLRIDEQLNKSTNVDVVEMPLKDVFIYLQELHQIPIVLKTRKLNEASIPSDTPVTKNLRGIRLSTALHHILDDLDLTYYIDDVLVITTPADAQAHPEVRIYDCRDILTTPATSLEPPSADLNPAPGNRTLRPAGTQPAAQERDRRAEQLMKIITTNVDPSTWSDWQRGQPGSGAISEFNGLIVVTQTAQTHLKVEHVLNMLREAAGLDATKAGKVVR